MKKGLVSSPFYPDSREDLGALLFSFEKLAESGMYDVLEFYYEGDASDYEVIGQKLADLGIEPVLHPGFAIKRDLLDLGSADLQNRNEAIHLCCKFIDYCYACGAKKMLVLSGPKTAAGNDLDSYLDRFADSLRQLCLYAASGGESWQPEITLEFFNDTGEPYLAIGNLDTVLKLTDRIDDLNGQFGITYDTSHVIQLGGNLNEYFNSLKKYIRHIHFA
ncbi:sugar phosphate isomerase/epimerase, partial [bacterium]|nr:sugar phosphate isomerase/epimerase [candidate division CSSED10-310 bacterium]